MRTLNLEKQAQQLADNHIYLNMSRWVQDLLQNPDDEYFEDALRITSKIDYMEEMEATNWELEYNDNGYYLIDRKTLTQDGEIRLLNWDFDTVDEFPKDQEENFVNDPDYGFDEDEIDNAIALVLEEDGIEPEGVETLEFWAVSPFMAEQLKREGEPVTELKRTYIWGRQTSGQAVYLDGVINRIAEKLSS